jgi:hypothetical protein
MRGQTYLELRTAKAQADIVAAEDAQSATVLMAGVKAAKASRGGAGGGGGLALRSVGQRRDGAHVRSP